MIANDDFDAWCRRQRRRVRDHLTRVGIRVAIARGEREIPDPDPYRVLYGWRPMRLDERDGNPDDW